MVPKMPSKYHLKKSGWIIKTLSWISPRNIKLYVTPKRQVECQPKRQIECHPKMSSWMSPQKCQVESHPKMSSWMSPQNVKLNVTPKHQVECHPKTSSWISLWKAIYIKPYSSIHTEASSFHQMNLWYSNDHWYKIANLAGI